MTEPVARHELTELEHGIEHARELVDDASAAASMSWSLSEREAMLKRILASVRASREQYDQLRETLRQMPGDTRQPFIEPARECQNALRDLVADARELRAALAEDIERQDSHNRAGSSADDGGSSGSAASTPVSRDSQHSSSIAERNSAPRMGGRHTTAADSDDARRTNSAATSSIVADSEVGADEEGHAVLHGDGASSSSGAGADTSENLSDGSVDETQLLAEMRSDLQSTNQALDTAWKLQAKMKGHCTRVQFEELLLLAEEAREHFDNYKLIATKVSTTARRVLANEERSTQGRLKEHATSLDEIKVVRIADEESYMSHSGSSAHPQPGEDDVAENEQLHQLIHSMSDFLANIDRCHDLFSVCVSKCDQSVAKMDHARAKDLQSKAGKSLEESLEHVKDARACYEEIRAMVRGMPQSQRAAWIEQSRTIQSALQERISELRENRDALTELSIKVNTLANGMSSIPTRESNHSSDSNVSGQNSFYGPVPQQHNDSASSSDERTNHSSKFARVHEPSAEDDEQSARVDSSVVESDSNDEDEFDTVVTARGVSFTEHGQASSVQVVFSEMSSVQAEFDEKSREIGVLLQTCKKVARGSTDTAQCRVMLRQVDAALTFLTDTLEHQRSVVKSNPSVMDAWKKNLARNDDMIRAFEAEKGVCEKELQKGPAAAFRSLVSDKMDADFGVGAGEALEAIGNALESAKAQLDSMYDGTRDPQEVLVSVETCLQDSKTLYEALAQKIRSIDDEAEKRNFVPRMKAHKAEISRVLHRYLEERDACDRLLAEQKDRNQSASLAPPPAMVPGKSQAARSAALKSSLAAKVAPSAAAARAPAATGAGSASMAAQQKTRFTSSPEIIETGAAESSDTGGSRMTSNVQVMHLQLKLLKVLASIVSALHDGSTRSSILGEAEELAVATRDTFDHCKRDHAAASSAQKQVTSQNLKALQSEFRGVIDELTNLKESPGPAVPASEVVLLCEHVETVNRMVEELLHECTQSESPELCARQLLEVQGCVNVAKFTMKEAHDTARALPSGAERRKLVQCVRDQVPIFRKLLDEYRAIVGSAYHSPRYTNMLDSDAEEIPFSPREEMRGKTSNKEPLRRKSSTVASDDPSVEDTASVEASIPDSDVDEPRMLCGCIPFGKKKKKR
ncbi:hypothetical protein FVE85_0330 [Porphyridium purpureum]|uniref:Uncharacterized protein n=1 Tax=Porphyridium purpureum TaxID=35688 RepID=A0A5J4YYB6_PORPP|nr:hypothetical protein FVE85_0330 [Porphyridium purpureum]|eukprot:POR5522..scf208_2